MYNDMQEIQEVRRMRTTRAGLWRVIYIARSERQAQRIEELLREGGFMVDRRPTTGDSAEDIEIKALESEAEEARLYLMERGL